MVDGIWHGTAHCVGRDTERDWAMRNIATPTMTATQCVHTVHRLIYGIPVLIGFR